LTYYGYIDRAILLMLMAPKLRETMDVKERRKTRRLVRKMRNLAASLPPIPSDLVPPPQPTHADHHKKIESIIAACNACHPSEEEMIAEEEEQRKMDEQEAAEKKKRAEGKKKSKNVVSASNQGQEDRVSRSRTKQDENATRASVEIASIENPLQEDEELPDIAALPELPALPDIRDQDFPEPDDHQPQAAREAELEGEYFLNFSGLAN
jgi:hypothetical protein